VLVSTTWLAEHLDDPSLAVVDMRWRGDGSGSRMYELGHIPNAVHLDWSTDLVDPDRPVAFMLAPPDRFARAMESVGVGDGTEVIAYADELGSGPFRLWWACRAYGHDQVRVLDGGFARWRAEGRPVTDAIASIRAARWTPATGSADPATAPDVVAARDLPGTVVLDSRPAEQYRGEAVWFETGPVPAGRDGVARTPRGELRAGHVPWARNFPAADLYGPNGTMKSPQELRALFAGVGAEPGTAVITYCGVGISASALLFGLERAGIEGRLYDASWEEWGRDPSLPVTPGPT
jgi:thiosulfate/3-mercaptopyruvate sulfurtransferase